MRPEGFAPLGSQLAAVVWATVKSIGGHTWQPQLYTEDSPNGLAYS